MTCKNIVSYDVSGGMLNITLAAAQIS